MYISPVSNNFYRPSITRNSNVSKPNFKGGLNDTETKNTLNMLKTSVSGVVDCKNIQDLKNVTDKLADKFSNWGIKSVGIMVIPEKDLVSFSNGLVSQKDASEKIGLCVAVGDKNGPVESWAVSYEAKIALLPKKLLDKLNK